MLQRHIPLATVQPCTHAVTAAAPSQTSQTQHHSTDQSLTWLVLGCNACGNMHAALLQLCPADMLQRHACSLTTVLCPTMHTCCDSSSTVANLDVADRTSFSTNQHRTWLIFGCNACCNMHAALLQLRPAGQLVALHGFSCNCLTMHTCCDSNSPVANLADRTSLDRSKPHLACMWLLRMPQHACSAAAALPS
jgi:hypothetical protein